MKGSEVSEDVKHPYHPTSFQDYDLKISRGLAIIAGWQSQRADLLVLFQSIQNPHAQRRVIHSQMYNELLSISVTDGRSKDVSAQLIAKW